MFHVNMDAGYPYTDFLTLADHFMFLTYSVILLAEVIAILRLRTRNIGDGRLAIKFHRLGEQLMWFCAPISFLFLILDTWLVILMLLVTPSILYLARAGLRSAAADDVARAIRREMFGEIGVVKPTADKGLRFRPGDIHHPDKEKHAKDAGAIRNDFLDLLAPWKDEVGGRGKSGAGGIGGPAGRSGGGPGGSGAGEADDGTLGAVDGHEDEGVGLEAVVKDEFGRDDDDDDDPRLGEVEGDDGLFDIFPDDGRSSDDKNKD